MRGPLESESLRSQLINVVVHRLSGMHVPSAHGLFFMLKITGTLTKALCLESET